MPTEPANKKEKEKTETEKTSNERKIGPDVNDGYLQQDKDPNQDYIGKASPKGGGKRTRKRKRMKGGHHLYKRLGVSKYSSKKQIRKAYNNLKKKRKATKKVKDAYKILSNKKTRKQYNDRYKKMKRKMKRKMKKK